MRLEIHRGVETTVSTTMDKLLTESTGAVIYPIILRQLISHPHVGFPWAVRTMAFIVFATNLVPLLVMRPFFLPQSRPKFDTAIFRDRTCRSCLPSFAYPVKSGWLTNPLP